MTQRVNIVAETAAHFDALGALSKAVDERARDAGVDPGLIELVRIRASQVNGCRFCETMHTRIAQSAGESESRLRAVANWSTSDLFSTAERAAMRLAEAVTLLNDQEVSDEDYQAAREHFADRQLASLLWTVALINAYNRLSIATTAPSS